jgi:hypothetical protein
MQRNPKSGSNKMILLSALVSILIASGAFGCAAAAVGTAGAVGGIVYTDRGAKGDVKGDVRQVNQHAKAAFKQMGIRVTGSEMKESGKEQNLSGKSGSTDVSVNMNRSGSDTTHVEVIAHESTFKWNKDYAKEILAKIIHQG